MVLLGKLNSEIVQRLNRHGQPAVGLSGEDGTLFEVAPGAERRAGRLRRPIERVDVDVLNHIAADYIPVIASSASDRDGQPYNVNADEAAGKVAAALGAHKAIFLTDVEGWLADADDEGSLISRAAVEEVEERLAGLRAACDRSCRPASTRSTAAPSRPTSSTAASPTASCWSSSPTPGSAPWWSHEHRRPDEASPRRASSRSAT